MPAPDGAQFTDIVKIPGQAHPVRFLSPDAIAGLQGRRVRIHGHTPASKHLGYPIYSVIQSGHVVGQATDIHLTDVKPYVHQRLLREAQEKNKKTANTFIVGSVSQPADTLPSQGLKIRPGVIVDSETGEDLSGGVSSVWLGPQGAKYRK